MTTVSSVPADSAGMRSSHTGVTFSLRSPQSRTHGCDGMSAVQVSRQPYSAANHGSGGSAFIHDCDVANRNKKSKVPEVVRIGTGATVRKVALVPAISKTSFRFRVLQTSQRKKSSGSQRR